MAAEQQAKKKSQAPQQPKTSLLSQGLIGLTWIILFFFLGSYLITESWTWGYRGKWTNINTYIPRKEMIFTEQELLQYDGSDPKKPIYLAIDGDVYDVTLGGGWYGKGGSYHHFAGKDAARAYVTGCFQDHLTHDTRGLSEEQLKGIAHWKKFYDRHHKYHKIGRVLHDPIPADAPIPKPCKSAVGQKP
ncbi:dihydrofolate reductase [Mucor lusitanicus]